MDDTGGQTGPGELVLAFEMVFDEQGPDAPGDDWNRLCSFILRSEGQGGRWEVTVALVDDRALCDLHARFMGINSVTDVMTFPHGDDGTGGGDIVISVDRAAAQGPEHGATPDQEIRFLFVHGMLHLCGWDDGSDADREKMLFRQAELLDLYAAG